VLDSVMEAIVEVPGTVVSAIDEFVPTDVILVDDDIFDRVVTPRGVVPVDSEAIVGLLTLLEFVKGNGAKVEALVIVVLSPMLVDIAVPVGIDPDALPVGRDITVEFDRGKGGNVDSSTELVLLKVLVEVTVQGRTDRDDGIGGVVTTVSFAVVADTELFQLVTVGLIPAVPIELGGKVELEIGNGGDDRSEVVEDVSGTPGLVVCPGWLFEVRRESVSVGELIVVFTLENEPELDIQLEDRVPVSNDMLVVGNGVNKDVGRAVSEVEDGTKVSTFEVPVPRELPVGPAVKLWLERGNGGSVRVDISVGVTELPLSVMLEGMVLPLKVDEFGETLNGVGERVDVDVILDRELVLVDVDVDVNVICWVELVVAEPRRVELSEAIVIVVELLLAVGSDRVLEFENGYGADANSVVDTDIEVLVSPVVRLLELAIDTVEVGATDVAPEVEFVATGARELTVPVTGVLELEKGNGTEVDSGVDTVTGLLVRLLELYVEVAEVMVDIDVVSFPALAEDVLADMD